MQYATYLLMYYWIKYSIIHHWYFISWSI